DRLLKGVCGLAAEGVAAVFLPPATHAVGRVEHIDTDAAALPRYFGIGEKRPVVLGIPLQPYQRRADRQPLREMIGAEQDDFLERQPGRRIERAIIALDGAIGAPLAARVPARPSAEAGTVRVVVHAISRIADDGGAVDVQCPQNLRAVAEVKLAL